MTCVTVIVRSRVRAAGRAMEEAAMDLGSHPRQGLKDVTLPVILPAILPGWLLAFVIWPDGGMIASFVAGPGSMTLPLLIRSEVGPGVTPDTDARAILRVVALGIGVALAGWIMAWAGQRRAADARMAYRSTT